MTLALPEHERDVYRWVLRSSALFGSRRAATETLLSGILLHVAVPMISLC